MFNFIRKTVIILILISINLGVIIAKPPKPGPNFVWVPKYKTPIGIVIPAHWKHKGKKKVSKKKYKKHYKTYHPRGFKVGR